jgi:uncharacterized membrane protein/uncharacterized membrane protein YphA (DoxX/SURF4 family)
MWPGRAAILGLGRAIFGGYFLFSGIHHFMDRRMLAEYARTKGAPLPNAAVLGSGSLILLGGLSVLTGVRPKLGASLIALFITGVSPKMHDFWAVDDQQERMQEFVNFTKNIALIGGVSGRRCSGALAVECARCQAPEHTRPQPRFDMNNRSFFLAGVGIGAGLTYFVDPGRGARRRARVRDRMTHAAAVTRRAIGTIRRDARHRAYGTAATLRTALRRDGADDVVIVERVRAVLGRLVSHPHAVGVMASEGVVRLEGPILKREAERLVRAVRRVRGVQDVIDRLEPHEQAGHVPSLQGGRAPSGDRVDVLQEHWAPTTRAIVGTAGTALVAASVARRDRSGTVAAFIGVGLVARATANLPVNRLTGIASRRRAVDIEKTITINARIEEVYAFWSLYENFPRFMSRVLDVRSSEDPQRSHWKVAGPAGIPVQFDAEITRAVPNQLIAWKTLSGSPVAHAGIVRLDPVPDARTRVHVHMSYNPPAGWLGHGIAAAFGADPKSSMDQDLVRMKTLIETGQPPHDAAQCMTQPSHGSA